MIFGNSLSGASSATYVGTGSAHSQTCPTYTIAVGCLESGGSGLPVPSLNANGDALWREDVACQTAWSL